MAEQLARYWIPRLKRGDDALNQSNQSTEGVLYRLATEWDAPQGHEQSRPKLLASVGIPRDGDAGNERAVNQTEEIIPKRGQHRAAGIKDLVVGRGTPRNRRDDCLVLVCDVEVMESTKRVVPAGVWSQSPDHVNDIWRGPVYTSLFNSGLEVFKLVCEWKVNSLGIAAVQFHKPDRQEIQGGPKIVDCITDDRGQFTWRIFTDLEDKAEMGPVGIFFDGHHDGIPFPIGLHGLVELLDVCFRPLNLES